jgi:hypothetical protein
LLAVLEENLTPPRIIILRGPAPGLEAEAQALAPRLAPRDLLLALPNGMAVPDALNKPESDRPVAWVCSGTACQPPITDLAQLTA